MEGAPQRDGDRRYAVPAEFDDRRLESGQGQRQFQTGGARRGMEDKVATL